MIISKIKRHFKRKKEEKLKWKKIELERKGERKKQKQFTALIKKVCPDVYSYDNYYFCKDWKEQIKLILKLLNCFKIKEFNLFVKVPEHAPGSKQFIEKASKNWKKKEFTIPAWNLKEIEYSQKTSNKELLKKIIRLGNRTESMCTCIDYWIETETFDACSFVEDGDGMLYFKVKKWPSEIR